MFTSLKRKLIPAVALLMLSAAVAQAAQPPVLAQVPDNAPLVLVIKNLKQFTTKLSNTGTRMKLPVPENLLATISGKFGVADGLDPNGSAAIMLLDFGNDKNDASLVAVLPSTDSKAMLKSFDAEAPDADGIMKITLAGTEQPCFAVISGKYVAIAGDQAWLKKFNARAGTLDKKLSPESIAAFDANDMVLYANTPAFGPKAADAIESARDMMSMQMAIAKMDKTTAAIADEAVTSLFNVARQALTDSNAMLVTFRLNDDGATFGLQGQFKDASPVGTFIASQKTAKPANLDGLPNGKILFAASGNWDKTSISGLFGRIADQILANPDIKADPKLPDIKNLLDAERLVVTGLAGEKLAFYQPADPANGWINMVTIADIADPQKAIDAAVLMTKLNLNSDTAGLVLDQKAEPNAKTVRGVSLTKLTAVYSVKDNAPPTAAAGLDAIKKMYGQDGLIMYYGIVGKQLVCVISSDPKLLDDAIAAAQTGDAALSKNPEIVEANKALQPNSINVAYLPITRWVNLILHEAGITPAEAPADKPGPAPAVISATTTGPNMIIEMQLPMSALIELSTTLQENLGALFH